MSIKILPARLANQIAAGEVVERPASVLKELLENSIDAGATAIEVDIEKGGHKKIKLTDNGEGISKDELTLALSRHATSKIHDLDDLEHIATLGFRGEALASISSVSRLTLTSKTEKQSEAWQARCEGRDMQVLVEPAAHPQGTSVEVLDLFFNTPARRKFLRTEKTEFNHIEELFRRFALSQFGVSLKLKHNGKLVKSLPAITGREQYLKRIRQICGPVATEGLVELNSEYQQFRLWGWISRPGQYQAMNDNQFVFVNHRMMKDKLIYHAIRQAYEGVLPEDKFPYFVLYLDVPTDEVDVNVHPAKHEVRFHQSRLIHDFIFSTINDALGQSFEAATSPGDDQRNRGMLNENVTHQYASGTATQNAQPEAETMGYIAPLQAEASIRSEGHTHPEGSNPQAGSYRGASSQTKSGHFQATERNFKAATENYQTLVTAPAEETLHQQQMTVAGIGLILNESGEYWLIPRRTLLELMLSKQLQTDKPVTQPLLLPVSVHCEVHKPDKSLLESCQTLGLDMQLHGCKLMLKGVPVGTRQQCWQDILLALSSLTDGSEMLPEPEQMPVEIAPSYIIKVLARHWRLNHEDNLMPLWQSVSRQYNSDDLLTKIARKIPIAVWLESEL